MATHLRRLKITIRDTRSVHASWSDRVFCSLIGMRWHWSVLAGGRLLPLAKGHARTEEKARKRADHAAFFHRHAAPTEYTYLVDEED